MVAAALFAWATAVAPASAMPPRRDGTVPPEVSAAVRAGVLSLPSRATLGTTGNPGHDTWIVPIILVDFTDQPLSSVSLPSTWEHTLFDTTHSVPTGSAYDYYQWVSRGRFRLLGKVVAIVHLSQTKNYYAANGYGLQASSTPHNDCGVVTEAISMCDGAVDFSPYDLDHDGFVDMLWVIHSGIGGESTVDKSNLYSVTSALDQWSGGSAFVTNDLVPNGGGLKIQINRFSILPELSAFHPGQLSEIGVFCHEFGHALGLPDLFDRTGGSSYGPGYFSLMSTGVYGGDGESPESPVHMGAWSAQYLGWVDTVTPAFDSTFSMPGIEEGGPVVDLWFQGESNPEHFVIEHRRRIGFDQHLPADGMVLYHLDESLIAQRLPHNDVILTSYPALEVVEANGIPDLIDGTDRGDAGDMFPGSSGRTRIDDLTIPNLNTFAGVATQMSIDSIQESAGRLGFVAHVRAPGWGVPVAMPSGGAVPGNTSGPAVRATRLGDDSIVLVSTDTPPGGRAKIQLHTRGADGNWLPPETVSNSSGVATEPAVTATVAGGVAVVWSDTRTGTNQLWYRSKLRGVWSQETRITSLPGSSHSPSVAADAHGFIHIAWLYTESGTPQVRYQRFYFLTPGDTSTAITDPTSRPDAPEVMATPGGAAIVMWPERASTPIKLWFCHVDPDSGAGVNNHLSGTDNSTQQLFSALVDENGTLHTVWMQPNASLNEIHYQRREAIDKPPSIRDTTLEQRAEPIQNLSLARDPNLGMHLAFEISNTGVPQVLYKHDDAIRGWDLASTEVTQPSDGIASRPGVVALGPMLVSVTYLGYPGGVATWTERHRNAGPPVQATSVPAGTPAPPRHWLASSPDPVRAGVGVRLVWAGPPIADGARLTLLDLAGRRIAESRMTRSGSSWTARFDGDATRGWGAGIYFARIEGQREGARLVVLR